MPDLIFDHPRLVAIYDDFDGERRDLAHYLAIVRELEAGSVLDVGCGTGSFACLLAAQGIDVTGIDPAQASLEIARRKPHAHKVRWIHGDAARLPSMIADLAVMTGNVAQVFLTDDSWSENIISIRRALRSGGHLVFESRDPGTEAWREWTPEKTRQRRAIPGVGFVEGWCEVIEAQGELVHFCWTYVFESDGSVLKSDSTLRFRGREALSQSLEQSGFAIVDVRGAPDRPGQEFVFIARRVD